MPAEEEHSQKNGKGECDIVFPVIWSHNYMGNWIRLLCMQKEKERSASIIVESSIILKIHIYFLSYIWRLQINCKAKLIVW